MISYTPLHVHTEKSLMDGVATADEYARRAIENEMTSVAVTDHGTLSYHRTFDRVMRQNDIKPIFGMEAYICPDINDRREKSEHTNPLDRNYFHLTILAKNAAGYKNLSKLNELSWGEGFFYKPRIDFSMLDKYRDGLIFGSACMGGLINSAIEIGEFAKAKEHLATLRDLAGDDFYIEIMPHNVDGINAQLYTMADEFRIKTIVTPDCHHAHVGQKVIQEIMLIANTHPTLITPEQRAAMPKIDYLSDERLSVEDATALGQLDNLYGSDRKMTFNKLDIHLLNAEEMWRNLGTDARWDSFENTLLVDSLIENIELPTNQDLLPVSFKNPNAELRKRCTKFLDDGGYSREYYDRLDEELAIVGDKGFDAYFLIVADAVQWARSNGITVGPGRGSGVSSLINYALGNTTVDPVKHGLLFFRFIDPSRSDWPDVDVDFEDRRRDEVKAYVSERYGRECVASIATYQKFQDKGVVKDVARVFSVPLGEVTKATKLIEFWDEYKTSPALQKFRDKYPQIERYGDQLRGRTRGTGMHASGMVTSRIPLSDIAPMETRSVKGSDIRVPVVAADMDETADIGLIKFDWLGLKALSTVRDTLELIYKRYKKKIKLYEIDYDDANVYRMLTAGHTSGVFQCEQAPYTKLLTVLGIDKFDELAATNALVRPGAANTIGKEYVQRKQGHKRITYVHPIVKSFTEETYGLPIYQEQIMLLCTELAGMSMSEANQVRRITSKKKDPIALEQYKQVFVAGASDKIGSEIASALWEDILKWSGYGFNKCTTGDTIVRRSGGNELEGPDITVAKLHERFHSKTAVGKKYRGKAGVQIFGMDADGRARAHRVKNVYKNGVKPVFKVTTEDGRSIRATSNHKHWTTDGYMSIDDGLSVGQQVSVCDFVYDNEHRIDPNPRLNGLGSGWAKAATLRIEASDGRMRPALDGSSASYRFAVALLDRGQTDCGHETTRPEIAHLDSNPRNNSVDNLSILCNSCHKILDYTTGSRKIRGSKGYSIQLSRIISIEYDGEEETYDIEMDSEEHNFFANGILTHNSHAVAYSYISYWTAWLKHYYPLEFMASTLKNEGDKDSRTQYLIEARRLGIKVLLPHINSSDVDFTIEGDAIRIGLSAIKYVTAKPAQTYIDNRPFASYDEVKQLTMTKNNGLSSSALKAMDAVGALNIGEMRVTNEQIKANLYEYLNLPETAVSLPSHWPAYMTTADDFDDQGAYVMTGFVTNIKRGKGWSLITVMDRTGSFGVFHDENTTIVKGEQYLFLIGSNRIVEAIPLSEVKDSDSGLIKWLNLTDGPCATNEFFVLSFNQRTTKQGKRMGSMIVSTYDRELLSMVVFATQFPTAWAKLRPGNAYHINYEEGRDGLVFKSVE